MRCAYFEVIECVRKTLLLGLPSFFVPGSATQLVLGLLISFLFALVQIRLTPFEDSNDDVLMVACQVELFVTLVTSLVMRAGGADTDFLGFVLLIDWLVFSTFPVWGFNRRALTGAIIKLIAACFFNVQPWGWIIAPDYGREQH